MRIEILNNQGASIDKFVEISNNICGYDLIKDIYPQNYEKYLAVRVNNSIKDLTFDGFENGDKIKFVDITDVDGMRVYMRTLSYIYVKACKDIFDSAEVFIEHSLNKGLYSEIKKKLISKRDVVQIKEQMIRIINDKKPINKKILKVEEAVEIFTRQNMKDKVELLKYWNTDTIRVYEIDGYYDTYYGYVAPNTQVIDKFDLRLFYPGIILNFPTKESNYELPEYIEQKKLSKVFRETEEWGEIMDVGNVGTLNNKIADKSIDDMIRINEALHEKKIAYMADEISKDKNIKIVLIAGPSSSGKTTFAQRLSIQLRANGKKTYAVSLDDYFLDREFTPRDENGEYDFETIESLDIELFNENLIDLMNCEKISIPTFNFKLGKREHVREPVKLTDDHIIIVEGIHGLNEKLTEHIPQKNKFKIYISALTQLNIDNHNRIATSDLRLIRRIVRDSIHRGHNALNTIGMWDSVVKGAEKYIFPYQENADAIFNSALVYEMCVLKKYAMSLIEIIDEDSEFYSERQRLMKFLSYFKVIENENAIPNTSILREFVGGSCFE